MLRNMKTVKFKNCVLILGDCFKSIPKLPMVDAVITDPPYNYEHLNFDWNSENIKQNITTNIKYNSKVTHVPPNPKLGGTRNTKWYENVEYVDAEFKKHCELLCELLEKRLNEGGYFLQFSDAKSIDLVGSSHRKFFHIKDFHVWERNAGQIRGRPATRDGIDLPDHNTCVINRWEAITISQSRFEGTTPKIYTKNGLGYIATKYNGEYLTNVHHVNRGSNESFDHISVKPLALMRKLVHVYCPANKVVLDPFMGSGTTGVACHQEGRKFIGIERDKHNFEISCDRINEAIKLKKLF